MVGIYKITNVLTGESYIGQSTNIEKRFREHLYHNVSKIDKAIHEIGKENFTFEVLEECTDLELDEKEEYYIRKYDSTNTGYNISLGGSQNSYGELNPNAKLMAYEVYNIRECYKNHMSRREVYELYKDKITFSYFANIWCGSSWKSVHMDVYTPENIEYYSKQTSFGEKSSGSVFTNQEVARLRYRYMTETAREIYEDVKDRCTFQTLQQILWGRAYYNVPIYDKKRGVLIIP